jgi:hypothetical protein
MGLMVRPAAAKEAVRPTMVHCGFTLLHPPAVVDIITEYLNKFFVCCKHECSIV